jgi:hypothetical protein
VIVWPSTMPPPVTDTGSIVSPSGTMSVIV